MIWFEKTSAKSVETPRELVLEELESRAPFAATPRRIVDLLEGLRRDDAHYNTLNPHGTYKRCDRAQRTRRQLSQSR